MEKTYYVRTQYDGKDYRSVQEIYYYDEDGEEQVDSRVTDMCMNISTCADQGSDTWSYIKHKVKEHLDAKGIPYEDVECEIDIE